MRRYRILIFLLSWSGAVAAQERQLVRKGNELYQQKRYEEASDAYRQAMLQNASFLPGSFNLGNAMYLQRQFDSAYLAYSAATAAAKTKAERAAAFFNLGNIHLEKRQWQQAVAAYKQSLRLNPGDEAARYNLCFALKHLSTGNPGPRTIQPSPHAVQLKARADALITARKYREAFDLMNGSLAKDSTIQAYADFMQRTKDIATINP